MRRMNVSRDILSQIFDEHHLVAPFVVDQLVNQLVGHQDAEAAGAQTLFVAHRDVAKRVARRIVHRRVFERAGVEALARILDPVDDRAFEQYAEDFDVFRRVEFAAVFDGVVEHFAEGVCDGFARVFWQVGFELSEQFLQYRDGGKIARHAQLHPVRLRRNDFNFWRRMFVDRGPDRRADVGDAERLDQEVADFLTQGAEHGFGRPDGGDHYGF